MKYWVLDSVTAAQGGDFRSLAKGASVGVVSARVLADHLESQDGGDYVVLNNEGRVVG